MIKAGDIIYGFCHGVFGRNSYKDKKVLHVGKVPTEGVSDDERFVGEEDYIVVSEPWWANDHAEVFNIILAAQGQGLLEELAPYLDREHDPVTNYDPERYR